MCEQPEFPPPSLSTTHKTGQHRKCRLSYIFWRPDLFYSVHASEYASVMLFRLHAIVECGFHVRYPSCMVRVKCGQRLTDILTSTLHNRKPPAEILCEGLVRDGLVRDCPREISRSLPSRTRNIYRAHYATPQSHTTRSYMTLRLCESSRGDE